MDAIWSKIASTVDYVLYQRTSNSILPASLVSGPLASTCAYLTKVGTSPEIETPHYQHVICLYVPDVYDKDAVTDVCVVALAHIVNC